MKRILTGILALSIALLLFTAQKGHKEDLTREEIIERGVRIKVEEFRATQIRRCRERAIQAAESKVDSMIRAMARDNQIDPKIKPPKTIKPVKPEVRELHDTIREALDKKKKREDE